jgi:hypothetical protein
VYFPAFQVRGCFTFADFYEITNVKLFDKQNYQPDRLYFPYMIIDYYYLLVNKN